MLSLNHIHSIVTIHNFPTNIKITIYILEHHSYVLYKSVRFYPVDTPKFIIINFAVIRIMFPQYIGYGSINARLIKTEI